jgi:16S rRNA (cytidine1402-2'-O)-methyltransferase
VADPGGSPAETKLKGGTLYVVATPIGNLDDLSPRAAACLRACRLIACEDTRVTRALVARFGLEARLISCHKFNETARVEEILDRLQRGEDVALVSDGGTPGISDPGAILVRRARAAGHPVVPLPGPSAVNTLLSASGFPSGPFTFIGFLPHRRGERRRLIESLRLETRPLLFFESPRRLRAALEDALAILGDREAFLGREMTKIHEEYLSGPLSSLLHAFAGRAVKGEVAFLVAGANEAAVRAEAVSSALSEGPQESPAAAVRRLVASGWGRKEAMRRVARERGLSRREVYGELMKENSRSEEK